MPGPAHPVASHQKADSIFVLTPDRKIQRPERRGKDTGLPLTPAEMTIGQKRKFPFRRFQSSPTSQGRRYPNVLHDVVVTDVVSILTHLTRQALPSRAVSSSPPQETCHSRKPHPLSFPTFSIGNPAVHPRPRREHRQSRGHVMIYAGSSLRIRGNPSLPLRTSPP